MNMMNKFLEAIISIYAKFLYQPTKRQLILFFKAHPFHPWITPNRVTIGRTLLFIPTMIALLLHHPFLAAFFVLFNELCDIVDGAVYSAHKELNITYNERLGVIIDSAADKIFNIIVWYSWLLIEITRHGFALPQLIIVILLVLETINLYFSSASYYSDSPLILILPTYTGKAKQAFEILGTVFLFIVPAVGFCLLLLSLVLILKNNSEFKKKIASEKQGDL